MQSRIIAAVRRFSEVSGLSVNVAKSVTIPLSYANQTSHTADIIPGPIATQPACRYLGHWAGTLDTTAEAWKRAFSALSSRLTLAIDKTNSAIQRGVIANAIIMPKLLYVAQHAWPTSRIAREAEMWMRNFIWNSSFARPTTKICGWASYEVLELPRKSGGLAMPNFLTELHALSANVVGEWSTSSFRIARIIGPRGADRRTHICPNWKLAAPVSIRDSIRATGSIWVSRSITPNFSDDIITLQLDIRSRRRAGHRVTAKWYEGGLLCDLRSLLRHLAQLQEKRFGVFAAEAVKHLPVFDLPIFTDQRQLVSLRKKFGMLANSATTLADVLDWKWIRPGVVSVNSVLYNYPMTSQLAHQFRELALDVLVIFPQLQLHQNCNSQIVVAHKLDDPNHVFHIETLPGLLSTHTWGSKDPIVFKRSSPPLLDVEIASYLAVPSTTVWTAPHPWATRLAAIWVGQRRWSHKRARYRSDIRAKRVKKGEQRVSQAEEAWNKDCLEISSALKKIVWGSLARIVGISTYQRSLLYRMLKLFTHLHEEPVAHGIEEIFSFNLNYPPSRCIAFRAAWVVSNTEKEHTMTTDTISDVVNKYWKYAVTQVLSLIWITRLDLIHNTEQILPSVDERRALLERQLQEGFDNIADSFLPTTENTENG